MITKNLHFISESLDYATWHNEHDPSKNDIKGTMDYLDILINDIEKLKMQLKIIDKRACKPSSVE